jgi:chromosome segregation ATPase
MAQSEPPFEDLKERLGALLTDWGTEISAVMRLLEGQNGRTTGYVEKIEALENQIEELAALRKEARDKDLVLGHLKKMSKEKDDKIAELEIEHKKALARVEELVRDAGTSNERTQYQNGGQHGEFEAMRTELAARKTLVKSLRADAEKVKKVEEELEENREVIATLKESLDHHAKKMVELRRSTDSWERKYQRLLDKGKTESSADGSLFSDTAVGVFLDETMAAEGDHTIVIDMTEPLRVARDERRKKHR